MLPAISVLRAERLYSGTSAVRAATVCSATAGSPSRSASSTCGSRSTEPVPTGARSASMSCICSSRTRAGEITTLKGEDFHPSNIDHELMTTRETLPQTANRAASSSPPQNARPSTRSLKSHGRWPSTTAPTTSRRSGSRSTAPTSGTPWTRRLASPTAATSALPSAVWASGSRIG